MKIKLTLPVYACRACQACQACPESGATREERSDSGRAERLGKKLCETLRFLCGTLCNLLIKRKKVHRVTQSTTQSRSEFKSYDAIHKKRSGLYYSVPFVLIGNKLKIG